MRRDVIFDSVCFVFFFKQNTAYEMRISDWSSDVCSSDLRSGGVAFGVWDPRHRDKRSRAWGFIQEGRVSNLNQARYDEQAELYQWLEEAVESLAGRISLNNRIYRG